MPGLSENNPDKIFETVFRKSELNFWDCFWTFRIGFSGLFPDSPGLIFGLCMCYFFLCVITKI